MHSPQHLFFEGVDAGFTTPVARKPVLVRRTALPVVEHYGFLRWLFARAELPIESYRASSLARRLPACLRALRAQTPDEAQKRIEAEPALLQRALNTVLLGVSEFLRDAPVFDAIGREILPRLASRPGRLRVWSAGCSDGQELYSLAIQFAEARLIDRTEFLGTDVRADAVRRAEGGIFPAGEITTLAPALQKRYFVPHNRHVRVCEALRRATTFRAADLFRGTERGPWDLVLCRNMVIYFEPASTMRIWESMLAELRSDAFLVVGKADHVHASLGLRRRFAAGIHQKGTCCP